MSEEPKKRIALLQAAGNIGLILQLYQELSKHTQNRLKWVFSKLIQKTGFHKK